MKVQILEREQRIPAPPEDVFPFFEDAGNLEAITPPFLGHVFEPDGRGGTIMRDRVRYALPFGPLGRLAHALFVRRDLRRIFDFRQTTIARRFEPKPTSSRSEAHPPPVLHKVK